MNSTERQHSKPQSIWGKFVLLMWKNWVLRKRHWILAILEVIIPLLFMILIVSLRTIGDSDYLSEKVKEVSTANISIEKSEFLL